MASEGFAGLQPTAWGKGDPALLRCLAEDCLLGLVVLGIRVIFHLGQDVWCIVFFFFFSLDLGHISIIVMIITTLLGAAHSHLETSLWIFFFLEELCALR